MHRQVSCKFNSLELGILAMWVKQLVFSSFFFVVSNIRSRSVMAERGLVELKT